MTHASDHQEAAEDHPLDNTIPERLSRHAYRNAINEWNKAIERVASDPPGAITAARALIETISKQILDELQISYSPSDTLQKLYRKATQSLGIAPDQTVEPLIRTLLGAAHQAMQTVTEIRNRFGDAHGRSMSFTGPSRAQAELAVNLAGSLACFLASQLDSHITSTKRLTRHGNVVLKFDKTIVWRLIDHARNSPRTRAHYDKDVGHCLLLVGDIGIYLMSNGDPPISFRGKIPKEGERAETPYLAAHAEGCGHFDEIDDWRPLHNMIAGGDDFALPIQAEHFDRALNEANQYIIIVVSSESFLITSDQEFSNLTCEI